MHIAFLTSPDINKKIMKRFSILFAILAMSSQGFTQTASDELKLQKWYLLDLEKDSTEGINLAGAYRFLQNKTANPIIVAVIDGGIDTLHEDLKNILWRNPKEKQGNGKDDDKNGYVDDIYGWNFLGNTNGENVGKASAERDRLYYGYKSKYEGKTIDINTLTKEDKWEYMMWQKAATQMQINPEEQMEVMMLKAALSSIEKHNTVLVEEMHQEEFSNTDLENFNPQSARGKQSKTAFLSYLKMFDIKETVTNKLILSDLKLYADEREQSLQSKTTAPIDYRALIIKDDDRDLSDINYGNPDVMGTNPEHGTHVSGIIAAQRNNGKGIDGVAEQVKIMSLRCVPDGDEYDKDIALAIRYATDNGARVINMSFGKSFSPGKYWVDEAIRYAASKDVLIVHAAGNDNKNTDTSDNFPNKYHFSTGLPAANYISVGASSDDQFVTPGKRIAYFSNYGTKSVDIFAPGYSIYSTLPGGDKYGYNSGTSMAAPVVSGVAALIRSYFPKLSAEQVKYAIEKSCSPLPFDADKVNNPGGGEASMKELCTCGGFLDAKAAVALAATLQPAIK